MRWRTSLAKSACTAVLAVLSVLLPIEQALSAEYSDLWVTPGEDAWGVNFVQWDSVLYATFYIYGSDNKPIWYSAVLNRDASNNFSGTLFTNGGTYFALPWKPGDIVSQVAGTAIFRPSTANNYEGTLIYTVNGVGTITKVVQRFNDHPGIPLGGLYSGGISSAYSGCKSSGNNGPFFDYYQLQVTQSTSNLSITFTFPSLTCTLAGTLSQNGLLYSINSATYQCSDQTDTTASISDLKLTAQGIERQYTAAGGVFDDCAESARFSAVRN
jgi:hypothetical protein